jgi:hypothetical protein
VNVDTGQFLALKDVAEATSADADGAGRVRPFQMLSAYNQGFIDGRDRLREETGLTEVTRIRSSNDLWAAECAAWEENVIRTFYNEGATAPCGGTNGDVAHHARPRRQRPGFLRAVDGGAR